MFNLDWREERSDVQSWGDRGVHKESWRCAAYESDPGCGHARRQQ